MCIGRERCEFVSARRLTDVLVVVVVVGGDFTTEEEQEEESVGTPAAPFGLVASAAENVFKTLFSVTVAIFLTVEAM